MSKLICWLFGHDYAVTRTTACTIRHSDIHPRLFGVDAYCLRCGHEMLTADAHEDCP